MLYEEFKNTISEFSSDLLNNITNEKNKLINIQKDLIDQLLVNKEKTFEILQDLEVSYSKKIEVKQNQINLLDDKISKLRADLSEEIKTFQIQHDLQPLKQKLMNAKEDNLSSFKQAKKKEINDLSSKINALDKECLLILKEKDNAMIETERNHKAKVAELERRMKLEVAKINESILTPVPNNVGKTEEELSESIFSKQKIKEIRKTGINEIAKIKLQYVNSIKKEKLAFNKINLQNEHDSQIIREEYNIKIAEMKYIREKHKRELEKHQDAYDFDTYIVVNDTKRDKLLEEKKIVNDFHLRMYQHSDTINRIEVKRNVTNEKITNQFLDKVKEIDLLQNQKFNELFTKRIESFQSTNKLLHEYLDEVISAFKNIIIQFVNNFWVEFYDSEKLFLSSIVFINYNPTNLNELSFKKAAETIETLNKKYQNMQEARYKKLINIIESNSKLILNQISVFINSISEYINGEADAGNVFYHEINKIINQLYLKNSETYNLINLNENKKINQMIENKKKNNDQETNNLKLEIDKVNSNYLSEHKDISDKKRNYDQEFDEKEKQILNSHHSYIASVKKNIELIKKKFNDDLKATQINITKENELETREIEQERKTKIKIGQI